MIKIIGKLPHNLVLHKITLTDGGLGLVLQQLVKGVFSHRPLKERLVQYLPIANYLYSNHVENVTSRKKTNNQPKNS